MTKLGEAENIWLQYLMMAFIIVIFGLVIWQVVMQEQQSDMYYISIVLSPLNANTALGVPDAYGSIDKGIQFVRDATNEYTDGTKSNLPIKIPHWSKWRLNVLPVINPATGATTNLQYRYSFPVRPDQLFLALSFMDEIYQGQTLVQYFGPSSSERGEWVARYFADHISLSLTYGDAGTTSNALAST